jgi:hypothetical protein
VERRSSRWEGVKLLGPAGNRGEFGARNAVLDKGREKGPFKASPRALPGILGVPGPGPWEGETALRTPDFGLWIRPTVTRRAGDVNPPVTVRARVARTAPGTHQSVTGRLTSTARHGTFFVIRSGSAA